MQALTRGATYTGNPQRTTCVARGGILSLASGRVALIGQVLSHYIQYRNQPALAKHADRPTSHLYSLLVRSCPVWQAAHPLAPGTFMSGNECVRDAHELITAFAAHALPDGLPDALSCYSSLSLPPWAHTTASAHLGTCKHTQHISVTHARILCNPPR